jgi:transcriptional regulator with XRE-family HTH domain
MEMPGVTDQDAEDRHYALALGERLRRVRQQQGLSLHDVEHRSQGTLKASVVGAYERGERAVSITRMEVLADFYRVPVAELLPDPSAERRGGARDDELVPEITIDLAALETRREEEPVLARYVDAIKARRGDYNGRVLTVRASDLETLAAVLDAEPEHLHERLSGAGIVR